MNSKPSTFIQHLNVLRIVIIRCALVMISIFILSLFFQTQIFNLFAKPLLSQLSTHHQLIATGLVSPLLTPLMFCFYWSLLISVPYLLYEIWYFVKPGLNINEKKLIFYIIIPSICLFYIGILFAYYLVFPMAFYLFVQVTPADVVYMPDIQHYLNFMITSLFSFGIAFETPIIIIALTSLNLISYERFANNRSIALVICLTFGMLITPPDVISQLMIGIPMYLLFELGLILSKCIRSQLPKSSI